MVEARGISSLPSRNLGQSSTYAISGSVGQVQLLEGGNIVSWELSRPPLLSALKEADTLSAPGHAAGGDSAAIPGSYCHYVVGWAYEFNRTRDAGKCAGSRLVRPFALVGLKIGLCGLPATVTICSSFGMRWGGEEVILHIAYFRIENTIMTPGVVSVGVSVGVTVVGTSAIGLQFGRIRCAYSRRHPGRCFWRLSLQDSEACGHITSPKRTTLNEAHLIYTCYLSKKAKANVFSVGSLTRQATYNFIDIQIEKQLNIAVFSYHRELSHVS